MLSVVEDLQRTNTATVCGILYKLGCRNILFEGVKPIGAYARPMVGPAYTLRFIPSRDDLEAGGSRSAETHREAFEATPPGHVLVMDCRSDMSAACCGDILLTRLMVRGGAGLVTDGGVRDSAVIAGMDIPVYARGASPPVNRLAHFALEHGRPIACGGVAVFPGDLVMGDADGVVVIPAALAGQVASEALAKDAQDAFVAERIRNGAPLKGNFPPNAETLKEFAAWSARKS